MSFSFKKIRSDMNYTFDFYGTPSWVTEALYKKEHFKGNVWEPACGYGHMSDVIKKYNECIESDVRTIEMISGMKGIDFLSKDNLKMVDNIITNPPYKLTDAFIYKSKEITQHKIAMLLNLQILSGAKRYYTIFADKKFPLEKVYILTKKVNYHGSQTCENMSASPVYNGWFLWNKQYKGRPQIDWILE